MEFSVEQLSYLASQAATYGDDAIDSFVLDLLKASDAVLPLPKPMIEYRYMVEHCSNSERINSDLAFYAAERWEIIEVKVIDLVKSVLFLFQREMQ